MKPGWSRPGFARLIRPSRHPKKLERACSATCRALASVRRAAPEGSGHAVPNARRTLFMLRPCFSQTFIACLAGWWTNPNRLCLGTPDRKGAPIDSAVMPKSTEADHVLASRADERLAHAYEQIANADEQLARLTEKLARMEQEAPHRPSVIPTRKPLRGRPALRGFIGLLAAVCVAGVALVSQSSYGEAARPVITRWAAPYVGSASWLPQASAGACRAYGPIRRSPGLDGGGVCTSDTFSSGRAARHRIAHGRLDACRDGAVAANDGARSRNRAAGDRTAQG